MKITDSNSYSSSAKEAIQTVDASAAVVSGPRDEDMREEDRNLRAELETERDLRSRLAAEYQNYRRRTEQERAMASDKGREAILVQLLAIADDLDRAVEHSGESPETVQTGVEAIRKRFRSILTANGVEPMETEGKKFDPELREAFDVASSGEVGPGMVSMETRRGYLWKDKLLRPALVIVEE